MSQAEIRSSLNKSKIKFARLAGDRVRVTALFVHRTARYEIDGIIDVGKGRVEPIRHRFTLDNQRVFDSVHLIDTDVVRTEFVFGNATRGARKVNLRAEPTQSGSIVTGAADGAAILPILSTGCSCHSNESPVPVLTWTGEAAKPITVQFKSSRAKGDLEGLVQVATTTIARTNNGSFVGIAGITSCLDYAFCLLACGIEYIVCAVGTLGTPKFDLFDGRCGILSGACTFICNYNRRFPS